MGKNNYLEQLQCHLFELDESGYGRPLPQKQEQKVNYITLHITEIFSIEKKISS